MKKVLNNLLLLLAFLIPNIVLAAGSASGSVPETIENGSNVTFTVKVSNTAAWNLKLSGTGATNGCSQIYADVTANGNNTSKSFTVTCKATNIGTITFTASGDITSADGTNSNVSITKTVNVVKPREKETEARLSSLTVDGYSIDFNKDKESYSVSVEPSVNSINISAKAISGRASISGTGKKELSADGGKYEIVCTAENGTKKTYTINVSIIDKNPINVKIDGVDYTVVKSAKLLKAPTNTTECKTKIKDIEVPSYTSEQAKITIIGLKDNEGNIKYATYDNDNYKLYNENKSSELLLYINNKHLDGYKETKVTINEKEYDAYEINDRFKIVYAMNLDNGEYNYYKYDTKENTFQYFEIGSKEETKKNDSNILLMTTILFAITTLCSVGYIVFSKLKKH